MMLGCCVVSVCGVKLCVVSVLGWYDCRNMFVLCVSVCSVLMFVVLCRLIYVECLLCLLLIMSGVMLGRCGLLMSSVCVLCDVSVWFVIGLVMMCVRLSMCMLVSG